MMRESQSLALAKQFLGRVVEVTVEHPVGSTHPTHGFVYEVNYGHVEGTHAPDGGELDAYVLGVNEPAQKCTGVCVAVVHRAEEDDDKLIVMPEGMMMGVKEIKAKIKFQEEWKEGDIILGTASQSE